jgi:hypothetical protein
MDPQQPTNPVSDDDDVEGHSSVLRMDGAQDADDVEGHKLAAGLDRAQDDDDVEGHMTGALGSKTDHER